MSPAQVQEKPETPKKSAYKPDPKSDNPIDKAILNAQTLIVAKQNVQADIQSARDFLNSGVKAGATNPDQTGWINDHLPKHTRPRKAKD